MQYSYEESRLICSDKDKKIEFTLNILSRVIKHYSIGIRGFRRKDSFRNSNYYGITPQNNFDYIPFNTASVLSILFDVLYYFKSKSKKKYRNYNYKFLDAGCGCGNILLLASCLGLKTYGIEIDSENIRIAKKILKCQNTSIIKTDLLNYDNYNEYDIIYYYVPIANDKLMQDLYNKITNTMKIGAILIPIGYGTTQLRIDKRFKKENMFFIKQIY